MTRFTATREFYIPRNARKITAKGVNAVFYVAENMRGEMTCMAFVGRAQKPTWNYRFPDCPTRGTGADRIARKIEEQIEAIKTRNTAKAERRAARNAGHKLEKGMILYTSWGYEQTNVDFFEVVNVPSKCFVEVVKIGSQRATDSENFSHGMAQSVVPNTEERGTNIIRRKVDASGGRETIKISSVETAWIWDGTPKYCSWYH